MNKYMATVIEDGDLDILLVKGAPEIILDKCVNEISNGKVIKITEARKKEILSEIQKLQAKSMRILGFGFRAISQAEVEAAATSEGNILTGSQEEGLIFNGFVAIKDPLRPDVFKAIETARNAGVETKMLTGDNINTARGNNNSNKKNE